MTSQSGDGLCVVTNTAERVEELVAEIDEALKSNMLPRRDGEKLRGACSSPAHKFLEDVSEDF